MNGYIHGDNNSSFNLDNRFNAVVSLLERMISTQQEILSELRTISRSVEKIEDSDSGPTEHWSPKEW